MGLWPTNPDESGFGGRSMDLSVERSRSCSHWMSLRP